MEHKVFGCKVNKFYLNKRLAYFQRQGIADKKNVCLVATCVVTDRAKSKRVKDVKKRLRDGQKVYLTGCGAFDKGIAMDYDAFFKLYPSLKPFNDSLFLLGEDPDAYTEHLPMNEYELNEEHDFSSQAYFFSSIRKKIVGRLSSFTFSFRERRGNRKKRKRKERIKKNNLYTKKFIVIQSGCDTFCTFCLTIYKRGSQRNRDMKDVIQEIQEFVENGGQEIVLTGVNLASRGSPHTRKPELNTFTSLLEAILHRTAIQRIRISSLGPEFLTDRFFELMENTRFLPHFHFSIQHFDDEVLRLMNRNYDSKILDHVLKKIRQLKRPDRDQISIGADLIVGFPGETDEAFQRLFDAVEHYGITKMHAFPFSPHQKGETVPAGKLANQVKHEIKKERERRLLDEGQRVREVFLAGLVGKKTTILLETNKNGLWQGWSENYVQGMVDGEHKRGDVVPFTFS